MNQQIQIITFQFWLIGDHSGRQSSPSLTLLSDFIFLFFYSFFYHYRNFHNSIMRAVFFPVLSEYRILVHAQNLWGFSRWCLIFLLHFRFFLSGNSALIISILSLKFISIFCFKWIKNEVFLFRILNNLNCLYLNHWPQYFAEFIILILKIFNFHH